MNILRYRPQLMAFQRPSAMPPPAVAPQMVWVVERGRPNTLPTEMTRAVAVSMQKPRDGWGVGAGRGRAGGGSGRLQ
jgi:hypothetical protein